MNSGDYEFSSLLGYFKKYNGLLEITSKNQPKTTLPSALFVTPKLGASCLELLKEPSKIYDLTNKKNSMLLITDSSGMKEFSESENKLDLALPHIEATCVYYKNVANIDAFPLILDTTNVFDGKELMKVLLTVAPAYSAMELYKIDENKLKEAIAVYLEEKRNFALFTSLEKSFLESLLKKHDFNCNSLFIVSCIMKAALETQSYILIPKELIEKAVGYLAEQKTNFHENFFEIAENLLGFVANYLIEMKFALDNFITVEDIQMKYESYLIEGSHANSNGLIEIQATHEFHDPLALDSLFTEENFNEISEYLKQNPAEIEKITCKNKFIANVSKKFFCKEDKNSIFNLPFMEGQASYSHHLGLPGMIPICLEGEEQTLDETIKCIAPLFQKISYF